MHKQQNEGDSELFSLYVESRAKYIAITKIALEIILFSSNYSSGA